jgi:5'-methylthioadenosine phosphorylase
MQTLGVLGGSGVESFRGLERVRRVEQSTPFGPPSAPVLEGFLGGTRLLFLARHGEGHAIAPHQINYRANVCALKLLGAQQIVSLSAVGSMKEAIHPGELVIVDQYVDLTKRRISSFFEDGIVAHVAMADPTCKRLGAAVQRAAERARAVCHPSGTYLCIEGPQFSTRAESYLYRSWNVDVIGMTAMPEARLAREAELPYVTLALATDYDSWHETAEPVSVQAVLSVMKKNVEAAWHTLAELAPDLPDPAQSPASSALAHALITSKASISSGARARLGWLIDKYLETPQ